MASDALAVVGLRLQVPKSEVTKLKMCAVLVCMLRVRGLKFEAFVFLSS